MANQSEQFLNKITLLSDLLEKIINFLETDVPPLGWAGDRSDRNKTLVLANPGNQGSHKTG